MEPLSAGTSSLAKQRRRITPDGQLVLEGFYKNVSTHPTLPQREDLSRQLSVIPGNDHYKSQNVNNWFKSRRARDAKLQVVISQQNNPVKDRPPLSERAIQHLTTLVAATPLPSTDVLMTWATLLDTNVDAIVAWMFPKRAETGNSDNNSYSPVNQFSLPTPQSETTSPEPFFSRPSASRSVSAPLKPEPAASPVIGSPSVPYRSVAIPPVPAPNADELLIRVLRESYAEAKALPVEHLTTATEFERHFASYQQKMENFLRAVQDGSLRELGWDPSIVG